MATTRDDVLRLTKLIRDCFQRLRTVTDALHADLGMTTALRAVLESLHEDGARTVPQVARSKSVSRQHIQKIVDALLTSGHVAERANAGHRRSPLIALTAKGSRTFTKMRRREAAVLAQLMRPLAAHNIAAAIVALEALETALRQQLGEEPTKHRPA